MRDEVKAALERTKPFLLAEGGNIEPVNVSEGGVVKWKLIGACYSCPLATTTLRQGIECIIGEGMPEIREVIAA